MFSGRNGHQKQHQTSKIVKNHLKNSFLKCLCGKTKWIWSTNFSKIEKNYDFICFLRSKVSFVGRWKVLCTVSITKHSSLPQNSGFQSKSAPTNWLHEHGLSSLKDTWTYGGIAWMYSYFFLKTIWITCPCYRQRVNIFYSFIKKS